MAATRSRWHAWLLVLALFAAVPATAQDFFWDGGTVNGGNPAANANGGAGTWDAITTNWDTLATGGADTAWVNGNNNATFGGTGGTVTLGVPITAHNLNFTVPGYTLTGGTLTLTGATPTITGTGTISSVIAGTAGLTTGGGANTLTLSGANTFTGQLTIAHGQTNQNVGSVVLASGASLATSAVTIGTSSVPVTLAVLQNQGNNQLTNATVTFSATSGRWAYWQLLGTSQSVVGIVDSGGAGVIENTEQHLGFGNSTLTLTGSGNYSFNGFMRDHAGGSGTLALIKNGTGTQTLSGANINYTGATTVNSGQLILSNAASFRSATAINSGGTLSWTGTANLNVLSSAHTIALNNGGTLENLNPANWTILNGAVTNTGTTTINQTSNATGVAGEGLYLDGGLKGTGTVTINAVNAGSGVNFRNNNTTFSGTIIVNGIASSTAFAGSGIGVGGCTTCLTNADITLNGTMELLNQGIGWGNVSAGTFNMGALNGTGVMVGNFTGSGGQTAVTLGHTNNDGSFSGVIANGTGNTVRIVKTGTGTQTFSGSNTYTGGTTISAGTLQLGDGGTSGSIVGNVVNNSVLAFNRSDAVTFGGTISGTGAVNQIGAGTTVLTAANTYTGGTTITAGTLQLGNGGTTGSILGNVVDNGVLAFNRSDAVTFGGVISGSGQMQQLGAGSTILTADSTYAGGTTISAGTLQLGNGGTSGSIVGDVVNNGTLAFNRSDSSTFSGIISGSGAVNQIGSGTTILASDNSYTGVTTISAGTLQLGDGGTSGSIVGDVVNNGTLAFNRSDISTFSGAISGSGGLNQIGSGTTILTGDSSSFTGATLITEGTLLVNGALSGSAVTVQSGATLGGSGTVGATTLASGGRIAPGNSIGTLTVSGSYSQASGASYQVELDPATVTSDRIQVTGTATLASGATLSIVNYTGAAYVAGQRYTILTSTGLTGSYGSDDYVVTPFLSLRNSTDATNAYLTVIQTRTVASAGGTSNEVAVGAGVDSLPAGNTVQTEVTNSPTLEAARGALGYLSGEIHGSAKTVLLDESWLLRAAVNDRLRAAFGAVGAAPMATLNYGFSADLAPAVKGPMPRLAPAERFAVWGQGYGSWSRINGDGNAASLRHTTGGLFIGADVAAFDTLRFGVIAGYSRSSFDVDARLSSGESDNYHLGLYGGGQWGALGLRAGLSYTWHDIETRRGIVSPGLGSILRAGYDAGTAQAFGELGYRIDLGQTGFSKVALEPFAGLAYVVLRSDGFSETGGAAALTGSSDDTSLGYATLGLRAATSARIQGIDLTLRGALGWRHAFGELDPKATLAFAGGSLFTIAGVPIARNAALVEAGLDLAITANATLGVSYAAQLASDAQDHAFKANLAVRF